MAATLNRLKQSAQHIQGTNTDIAGTDKMSETKRPNITLYTDATPNGIKISVALEELGIVS